MTFPVEIARAKVNVTLRVLGRRADGYHELESLVAFAAPAVDVSDEIAIDGTRPFGLTVTGAFACAIDGVNLAGRASELAVIRWPTLRTGHITLTKRLPIAAGLGGGSADAAAVLRALQRLNPRQAGDGLAWFEIARRLGADVPVCLSGRSSNMTGVGERIEAAAMPAFAAVLVNSQSAVAADKTARVFAALRAAPVDRHVATCREATAAMWHSQPNSLTRSLPDLIELMRAVGNDLEPPALQVMPEIAVTKAALLAADGCLHAQLSGAGPTCFGVFPDPDVAHQARRAIEQKYPSWWVRSTIVGD